MDGFSQISISKFTISKSTNRNATEFSKQ